MTAAPQRSVQCLIHKDNFTKAWFSLESLITGSCGTHVKSINMHTHTHTHARTHTHTHTHTCSVPPPQAEWWLSLARHPPVMGTGPDGPVMAVSASVSRNTPVTAGTCVASHSSPAMETNYLPPLIYSKGTRCFHLHFSSCKGCAYRSLTEKCINEFCLPECICLQSLNEQFVCTYLLICWSDSL